MANYFQCSGVDQGPGSCGLSTDPLSMFHADNCGTPAVVERHLLVTCLLVTSCALM